VQQALEEAETDHRTGKDEESEVNVVAALVADHQPAAARDPGQGAFDHPAVPDDGKDSCVILIQ
jgi:hypothetical protein